MTRSAFSSKSASLLRSPTGNRRGQALTETALVVVILVILFIGIVELGRTWMILSMINHGLRDGARSAALAPVSTRTNGIITNSTTLTAIHNQVLNEVQGVGVDTASCGGACATPCVNQSPVAGPVPVGVVPLVTVRFTCTVPYAFGLFGASFAVDRSVTFRDEGRGSS